MDVVCGGIIDAPENLVDDVPLEDLALVVGDDSLDVVLNHGGQGVTVVDGRHPAG